MWNKMPTLIWLAGAAFTVGALAATPNANAGKPATAITVNQPSATPTARAGTEPGETEPGETEPGETPAGTQTTPPPAANPQVTVLRLEDTKLGPVLTDGKRRTLYLSSADDNRPPTTTCYGKCARLWVPLRIRGKVVADEGVNRDLVGALPRKDGIVQATYNGWPLYWFTRDRAPGDTTGQGYRNSWSAIGPEGKAVR